MKKKRFLLLRYGGMGDALFLTPVARWLFNRGYAVDVAIRKETAPLLENNPFIDKIYPTVRFGPAQSVDGHCPANLLYDDGAWIPDVSLYDRYPSDVPGRRFDVADYFRSIESSSIHPAIAPTQNSDYVNTFDLHLGWAGIDPTRMAPEERCPVYHVGKAEKRWAKKVTKHWGNFVLIQTLASSPARSFLGITQLVEICKEAGRQVAWWNGSSWIMDGTAIPFPEEFNGMRASAALIQQADLLVSSDTCVSHIAEAVRTQHLTFYTTVPSWTRSRDYQHETTIDSQVKLDTNGEPCKCCVIGRDCIRRTLEARAVLSEQDKELIGSIPRGARKEKGLAWIPDTDLGGKHPAEYYNAASPQGWQMLVQAAIAKFDSQRQLPAYCVDNLRQILPDKLEEILEARQ